MNGRSRLPAANRPARRIAITLAIAGGTILVLEGLTRAIQAPVVAPGSLMAVAVVASIAGITYGLLAAACFVAYGGFVYAAGDQPFVFDPDGALRFILLALTAVAMAGLVGALRHRAARQRAIDLEREALARQRMVTDTSADAIVTIDEDSRILFANAATGRIFGHPVEEIMGGSLTRLMPDALRPRHLAAFARYLETGTPSMAWHGIELVGLHADGSEIPLEVSFAEFLVDGRRTFTGTIRDISERRLLQSQLVESQRMEAVGRMAGAIAHDFNNILTAVSGYASLAKDGLAADDPVREDVEGIQQAATGATSLVRQLLTFSRRQPIHTQVVDLTGIVDGILPMINRLIGENVSVDWRPPAEPVWPIEADPSSLDQVVLNLALNARDAMPDGGTITIEVANTELGADYARTHLEVQPGPHALLAVSDTGIGMDRATMAHVFEPFFTTKQAGRGTGLGLATVYGIVKQSHGSLSVYSEPGHGSTFKVYFPRAQGVAVKPVVAEQPEEPVGGRETVLVAEDEDSVRELVTTLLRRLGYRVLVARDGPEAVRVAATERIDVLLTDVIMPGQGGPEVATRVRDLHPDVRVVFMSGYTAGAIDRQSLIEQDAVLLQKPFPPSVLAATVRSALTGAVGGEVVGGDVVGDEPVAGSRP